VLESESEVLNFLTLESESKKQGLRIPEKQQNFFVNILSFCSEVPQGHNVLQKGDDKNYYCIGCT